MKKISRNQSCANMKKRQRKARARKKVKKGGSNRTSPVIGKGKIHFEVGGQADAMHCGGMAPIHEMVKGLGLPERINRRLELLQVHLPYHESDHILSLIYNILTGGSRLEDLEALRSDTAFMDSIGADRLPDPTTSGDFLRRFDRASILELMDIMNELRSEIWKKRGRGFLDPVSCIDIDGTLEGSYAEKKVGMDFGYTGAWGYAPLLISLANTSEVLYLINRSGNEPSHKDAAQWIDRAIELLEPHSESVCLRGDTAYYLTSHFDRWAERVDFVFGMPAKKAVLARSESLPKEAWRPFRDCSQPPDEPALRAQRPNEKERIVQERAFKKFRLNFEEIAEFRYQPEQCRRSYRVVALRKNISVLKGYEELFEDIRTFFFITTREDLSAEEIVHFAHRRCNQENVIEQLKNGVNAMRMPVDDLLSNWAYMVIAAQAWNIKSWFGLMMHYKADRSAVIRMEFRRFLRSFILVPARVVRRSRQIIIRIIGYLPEFDRLFSAWNTVQRLQPG